MKSPSSQLVILKIQARDKIDKQIFLSIVENQRPKKLT